MFLRKSKSEAPKVRRIMRKMSGAGDELVAEWDETVAPERLAEIEKEFNSWMAKGNWAADIDKEEVIKKFDPNANVLLMPRLVGGRG
jgi:hypothetical protein